MATEDKSNIRLLLEKALEKGPQEKAGSGIRAQLGEHRDLIVKALRQGYSATSLARFFAENGIDASVDTLRAYVAEVAGKRKKTRPQKAAKSSAKSVPKSRKGTEEQPRPETSSQTHAKPEAGKHPVSQGEAQSDDPAFHAALKRKL